MKNKKAPGKRGQSNGSNAPKKITRRRFKCNREQRIAASILFGVLLGYGFDAERFGAAGPIWAYSDHALEDDYPIEGYVR